MFHVSGNSCLSVLGRYSCYRLKRRSTWENARPRRASTFVGQNAVCRTKVQLAVVWRQQKSAPENLCSKLQKSSLTASGAGSAPGAILQPSGTKKKSAERTGADIKPEMLKTIISCITNKIFHYQKMERNTQNPASCTPFTSHSWNRYGIQERLLSPLHKRSRSRMNAVENLQNHKFMNARIL